MISMKPENGRLFGLFWAIKVRVKDELSGQDTKACTLNHTIPNPETQIAQAGLER